MKILVTVLILLVSGIATSQQNSRNIKGIDDSLKIEITNFENTLFDLPVDVAMDTTAIYIAVYEFTSSTKIRANSTFSRKKEYSYLKLKNDTLLIEKLIRVNNDNIFKDQYIFSQGDLFNNLKNHTLPNDPNKKYIIGFDKKYLIIRRCLIVSTTDSRQTGPSYFIEKYVYYKRKN